MKNKFIRTIAMLAAIQSAFILSSCNSGSNGSNPYNSNPGGSDPQISAPTPAAKPVYQSVIDAGSSGSRIYNYMKSIKGGVVTVVDIGCSDKTSSPLDKETTSSAKISIENLVKSTLVCLNLTTAAESSSVTVNLLATAGMRGLTKTQQDNIYAGVKAGITAAGATSGAVDTITGSKEGLYSWANINYLQGTFEPNSTQIQTNGIYEVGGASAQIAFQISDGLNYESVESRNTSFNHHKVKVNGKSYNVVSISHLGLGQNNVRTSLWKNPATNYNTCYPSGYDAAAAGTVPAIKGTFNYQGCSDVLNESINDFTHINTLNTIPGFYDVKFIGLSGVTNALKFWGLDKDFDKPKYLEASIKQTCPLYSWVQAQSFTVAGVKNAGFDNVACQNAVYINNMLYNHFKFAPDQIKGVETINGQTPTWTQGFVVVE